MRDEVLRQGSDRAMRDIGNWLIGTLMGLIGLLGLIAASGARDSGFYLFGLLLFGFSVLFIFNLIRRAYDERAGSASQ
jgi:hypothetical protein